MFTKSACFVLGVFILYAGPVVADDFNRTVAAGKRTLVGQFALYDRENCYAGAVPEAKIATQPANGRLDITEERASMNASGCGAISFTVRRVYYTPRAGYRGEDRAAVDFFYNYFVDAPRPTSRRQTYSITVK